MSALGFDLEWRAAQRTGESPGDVATLQLYGGNLGDDRGIGALIHVISLGYSEVNPFPPELIQLLRSKKLAGCNIANDAPKLTKFGCIVPEANLVKLERLIHEKLRTPPPLVGRERWSLEKLCRRTTNKELDKKWCHPEGSRRVNWERFPLQPHEHQYAMNDAHVPWLVFFILMHPTERPRPPQPPAALQEDADVRAELAHAARGAREWLRTPDEHRISLAPPNRE